MDEGRDRIRFDLIWIADDFACIVAGVRAAELDRSTDGTRWSNRQMLFHLVLGQKIARAGIPLLGGFSRLPPAASRGWSRMLEAGAKPYDWVNWAGSAAAGRVLPLPAMVRMMRGTTRAILRWFERADDAALARGMTMPPSWDPYFQPWMSRRDVLLWAPKHYRHHRRQLTLSTLPPLDP